MSSMSQTCRMTRADVLVSTRALVFPDVHPLARAWRVPDLFCGGGCGAMDVLGSKRQARGTGLVRRGGCQTSTRQSVATC